MESVLSSTFSGALSQRADATAVDSSGLIAGSSPEVTTDRGTMGDFSAAEMDFETRNWRAARQSFQYQRGHKDKKAMDDFLRQQESPQHAKASCVEASQRARKEYAPGVGGVLSKIETFMKVGDVAMKTAPESVGLAWMGIRLCMHSVEDDFATFNLFSGAASDIIGILISCRVYGKMYGGDGGQKGIEEFKELHQKVVDYIPGIYTEILEFSYQMSKQIGRHIGIRVLKGFLSSASNKFRGMIEGIRGMERTMSGFAKKATDQLSIYYQEVNLQRQGIGLENQQRMMANLAVIQDTLNSNLEIQKVYADQIKQLEEEKKSMKKKTPLDKAKEKFEENAARLKPTTSSEVAFEKSKARKDQGTCEWIFDLEDYKAWRTSVENSMVWISGVGGMGKSILLSSVIDRLQTEFKDSVDCFLQYFICSAGDDTTRLAARIKEQLVHQVYKLSLLQESSEVLEKANELVTNYLGSSDAKTTTQQKKSAATTFENTFPSLARLVEKRIYLIIDALDECTDRKDSHILRTLQDMLSLPDFPDFHFHVLICSRPEADVVNDLVSRPVIKVEDHNAPDIERAAKLKLSGLPGFSPAERELACEAIVKKAKGLFRCVDPAIEFLKKPLQRPLERALARLPDGLDNSYQQILSQTDPEYLELLKTALQWSILGLRKPTIAEVMDDYSRAYEQEEGSDSNPYDDLEDPTKPEETRRLIPDQIRAAGSSTFLEVSNGQVMTRHTTVTDFFLRPTLTEQPIDDCKDSICASCRSRAAIDRGWTLTQKEGQLQMTITIFKHLNSPLFRKRYLPEEEAEPELRRVDSAAGDSEVETVAPADASSAMNGNAEPDTSENGPKSLGSVVESELMTQHLKQTESDIDAVTTDVEKLTETANDGLGAELAVADQGHLADDESLAQGDEGSVAGSNSYMSEALGDDFGERPVRYELVYWPDHLRTAEDLWTREERLANSDWKELWGLVLKFLCDSPGAFKAWKRRHFWLPYISVDPLQVAAAYGLTGLAEVLIQQGQSATAETDDGRSALWFAAEHSLDLLKLLLEHGANPNAHQSFQTPFHRLLWLNPKLENVRLMLDYKGDCITGGENGWTAIQWFAVGGSDPEILRLLLDNGGEINAADSDGETGLHKITWQNPLPLPLYQAFIENGADVNRPDKESQQPLYEVCSQGLVDGARILLDNGADIEDADVSGITALHIAATYGHLEVIKLLVERKALLTKQDNHLRTAFYFACANNHFECTRYLLTAAHEQGHHESTQQPTDDGRTPFSKACGRGNFEVVELFLSRDDVHIDANAVEGAPKRTALHWAAYNGRVEVALLLLKSGADATIADASGKTALGLSGVGWWKDKSLRREPMILALIEQDRTTAAEDTDLMAIAAIRGSATVLEKLLDAKAHPSKQDEHGWTPLQLARQYGNTDAAAVLAKRGAIVGSRPSKWVTEFAQVHISEDGCGLEITDPISEWERFMVLANHPIPAGIERFYFEVEIKPDLGRDKDLIIGIGFATQPAQLQKMPGWNNPLAPSWAFHGDDGRTFANSDQSAQDYAEVYGKGATVGCGVIFKNGVDGNVFYTRDGEPLGVAFEKGVCGRLYPAVGMGESIGLIANWGDELEGKPFKWARANGGLFDLEDVVVKSTDEQHVTAVIPTNIDSGSSVPLGQA